MKVQLIPTRWILVGIAVCAIPITISAQSITGSKHDFSGKGWTNLSVSSGAEICVVCHTPHNGTSGLEAPLWNHALTVATFTPYASSTLDASVGQPDGVSLVCLSCHDGTVALDAFGSTPGVIEFMPAGARLLGTDLANDHPVSFTYDTALASADGGLFDPAITASGLGGTIEQDFLRSGKVQCASCHNPHDVANGKFLRKDNTGSALCLTCHDK